MHVHDFLAEGRMEMFNLNCKLINFLHHLKERAGVDSKGTGLKCWIILNCSYTNSKSNKILPADCVDLMDSSGKVMNLAAKQHNLALASSVLVARHYYVLLRVCRESVWSIHQQDFRGTNTQIIKAFSKPNYVISVWSK